MAVTSAALGGVLVYNAANLFGFGALTVSTLGIAAQNACLKVVFRLEERFIEDCFVAMARFDP